MPRPLRCWVNAPHVGPHRIQFAKRTQNIVAVASFSIHWMPDDDLIRALPMTVDASISLFHHIRVVRNFEVDHQMAVVLEINALGGRICRQQYPHRRFRGVGLERGFHGLTLLWIHTAIDESQSLAPEAVGCEDRRRRGGCLRVE